MWTSLECHASQHGAVRQFEVVLGYVGGYKYSSEVLLQVPRLLQAWNGGTERIVVPYWSMYRNDMNIIYWTGCCRAECAHT